MKQLMYVLFCLTLTACGSGSGNNNGSDSGTNLSNLSFPDTPSLATPGTLRPVETGLTYNKEAVVPPQCYTKHEATYNPCMTCHQTYTFGSRPNSMDDGGLQYEYAFSDLGITNHWLNLFEDRSEAVSSISDQVFCQSSGFSWYHRIVSRMHSAY